MKKFTMLFFAILLWAFQGFSQDKEAKVAFKGFDGIVVVGYVNQGGYLNFTGPNASVKYKNSKFIIGMLPSLRFKKDTSTPKNPTTFPSLGVGFTYCYKHLAVQLPLYYTPKTAIENGRWNPGIGIGIRFH